MIDHSESHSNKQLLLLIISLVAIAGFIFAVSAYFLSSEQEVDRSAQNQQDVKGAENSNNTEGAGAASTTEVVKSLEGVIENVNEDDEQLKINFEYKGNSWSSKVEVEENTRLGGFNDNDDALPPQISLSSFKKGQEVIVSADENILGKSTFPAINIVLNDF